ncbi:MAG TPA: UDP-glucose--hexose-1-phosphate uridylyltransferase [Spirochaetia bacterium]|nr:UDP-glucose--hexose-1-phosphate uridylyltransferase [Spirochaetia bacterium]
MNLQEHAHRRYNPLSDEWVLISPHRTQRPWQGKTESAPAPAALSYDPKCYLCPGNSRAGGVENPKYEGTFLFVNDFSALLPEVPMGDVDSSQLIVARSERGICKVLCFSPRHDLTLARMKPAEIRAVVDAWVEQYHLIGSESFINYVQIFENRGDMMGASNPHPHGQIWANESVPNIPQRETERQAAHWEGRRECMLCSYLQMEIAAGERVVLENDSFAVLVPFWAVWPFEVMVLPKTHHSSIEGLSMKERDDLALALRSIGIRYDNLFETSFPYSMGIHQRPTDGKAHEEWHLHLHYFPPLLRSATVKKFMVGYELLGMPQRDITAEGAAQRLRGLPATHYLER